MAKQVPMSEDASAINNLLLEVIQPYFSRLSTIGVMQSRDVAKVCSYLYA